MDMGFRKPEFDINITSEKANPYKKMEQNELALNFYNMGFFNPQMSDQAIACLEMMDFNGKEDIIQRIRENGTLLEMLTQFEQIALTLAQKYEPQLADRLADVVLQSGGQPIPTGDMVVCTEERSQLRNKQKATKRLREIFERANDQLCAKENNNRWKRHTRIVRGNSKMIFVGEKFTPMPQEILPPIVTHALTYNK